MESEQDFNNINDLIQSQQVYRRKKKQMSYKISLQSGPWSRQQNIKYAHFIDKNRAYLTSKSRRREGKIFKEMALSLGTRNSIQCRSYHQRQLYKYKNITNTINFYLKKQRTRSYQQITNRQNFENLPINSSQEQNHNSVQVKIEVDRLNEAQIILRRPEIMAQTLNQQLRYVISSDNYYLYQNHEIYILNREQFKPEFINLLWYRNQSNNCFVCLP